ncbi:MAG: hypothetical protein ACRC46_03310 [Thermoguttaceae bacterium]
MSLSAHASKTESSSRQRISPRHRFGWAVVVCLCLFATSSCHQLTQLRPNAATELLRTAATTRNVITLEVFHIRVPHRQSEATLTQLWREIDEQVIPPATRQAMMRQGFRAGVQGMSLSPTMARFLQLQQPKELAVSDNAPAGTSTVNATAPQTTQDESLVRMKVVNVFPPHESPVTIEPYADPLPECSLFWQENGRTIGQTYRDALGRLVVTVQRAHDGGVKLEVTPELRYGNNRSIYQRTSENELVVKYEQPCRTFSEIKTSVTLLTGQWLIIGTTPAESGTNLGRCFFSRRRGDDEQKIIAIRIVNAGN